MRKRQKERIKQRIRQTKIMEKEGGLQGKSHAPYTCLIWCPT